MAVLPPATDAQVIAGTILGIAGMVINASMKETLVLKTVSYLALVTAICVVIFWVFMALRPANAQQGYRPLSNKGRFHGYVTWPLYCGIAKCNDR